VFERTSFETEADTKQISSQDEFGGARGSIRFDLMRETKSKIKRMQRASRFCPSGLIFENLSGKERKRTHPAEEKIQLKKKNTSRMKF
jgi:hypothetical protein